MKEEGLHPIEHDPGDADETDFFAKKILISIFQKQVQINCRTDDYGAWEKTVTVTWYLPNPLWGDSVSGSYCINKMLCRWAMQPYGKSQGNIGFLLDTKLALDRE